jgi:hypothetical protein
MELDGEDESEGSSRERVFVKKSKGKKSGMKARWNASRTPGEETNVMYSQVDEQNSIMGGGEVLNEGDIEMTSFDTRSGIKQAQ